MNCPLCKSKMIKDTTTLTFNIEDNQILVVKNVPALICEQCGEEFIDIQVTKNIEEQVKKAVADGINMGFLNYYLAA